MLNTPFFKKLTALFFILNIAAVNAQEDYSSLLWKIDGNGLEKPSYLYGTMHVSSKIAFNLGDEFFDALSSVDAIALETNPEVWLDFYRGDEVQRITSVIDNRRTSFADRGFYNRFSRVPQYDLEGFQEFLAPQDRIVNQLLYRFNYGNEDYEETTYLDMFLFQTARKEGKEVYSLEDFTESFFLARRASLPDEDEDDEVTFRSNGVNQGDLQTAYLERDLNTLDSMITEKFSNNYRKYLLDIRNDNMVVAMDSLMPKMSIFAGVGAAHLAGENGMIEMLRSKGYTVEAVQFNKSSSSNKKFNKIKASSVNVPMEKYTSEDGRISLQSIGEFYPENQGLDQNMVQSYFLPDFSNGAYYSYKRMSKLPYGENYREKGGLNYIDSILYLATPGDISKQKSNSVGNYEAIEVTSELSRNRYLKQLIIDTPEEILVFKASGNKSFIKDKNVKNYFNSIRIEDGSKSPSIDKLGIQVDLPANFVVAENDKSDIYINGETDNGNFFSFRSAYLKDLNELEQDHFELTYLVRSLAEDMEYDISDSVVDLDNKTIHATIKNGDHKYYVFYQIYHNFYYQIIVENDEDEANKIIDSFFKKLPNYEGVEMITENDTLLNISYSSYYDGSLDSLLYAEFKSLRDDFQEAENREDSLDRSFEGEFNTRLFKDPLTGEVVGLKHSRLNDYYSLEDGLEGVKDRVLLKFSEDSLYYNPEIISENKTDTSYQIEYRYSKNGTDRVLHYNDIIIGNVFITISTTYDTTLPRSEFSKQIFNSLRPKTRSNENNFVTRKKGNDWLEDIRSDEYQISEQAKESLGKVIFDESDLEDLEKLLLNDTLEIIDNELRIQLLSDYSYFFKENDDYLSFLTQFYEKYKDNPDIQVAILDDIGKVGTEESTKKFVSIIVDNPPMTNDDYDLYNMFRAFEDSTHLLKPHLSQLEQFATDFDEFLPRIVYLISRANLNGSFSSNDLSDEFLEKLEKTAKQNIRKIAFSDDDIDDILSDMLDLGVVLLLHDDAEERFSGITKKLDTISDKRFKANFLSKRINRGLPYTIEEVEEVINDTTYAHVFFDWADYIPGVQDSLFEALNPKKELIYQSYAIENGGYRVNKDSLKFHSKVNADTYMEEGDVYIYTSVSNYGSKSVIAVYFVDPESNYTYEDDLDVSSVIYEEGKLEEAIEELMLEVELSNRVRVNNGYGYGFF